jgi:hypothetical protein
VSNRKRGNEKVKFFSALVTRWKYKEVLIYFLIGKKLRNFLFERGIQGKWL